MKLIDILARELKEWPEGWAAAAQEANGSIAGFSYTDLLYDNFSGWNNVAKTAYIPLSRNLKCKISDDQRIAIITRAQWQAAVDALKAEVAPACERERVTDEMYGCTVTSCVPEIVRAQRSVCDALYDAGYRKFEIVNEGDEEAKP